MRALVWVTDAEDDKPHMFPGCDDVAIREAGTLLIIWDDGKRTTTYAPGVWQRVTTSIYDQHDHN